MRAQVPTFVRQEWRTDQCESALEGVRVCAKRKSTHDHSTPDYCPVTGLLVIG